MLAASEEKDRARTTPSTGVIPQIYRRGLFWAGFAIVSVVHGWNLICTTGLVPGLPRIKRVFYWDPYVEGSIFDGIRGAGKIDIFFVMLGLAFFIPANISFSLWLFFVLFLVQLLFMVWLGFGVNLGNFPCDWWDRMNFRHAEGGGALVIFAIMVLWKCRKYFLCGFRPGAIRDLEKGEQMELRISSLVFVIGSILLVLIIWLDMGASLFWTCFVYVIIMVVTIGLIRAVAEGGILGFQCWFGPFHLIRAFRGLFRWTRRLDFSNVFAPLLTYYSVLFLDIKAFIAPAMANSIKIRDDLRMSRFRFHISVICGIGAAMMISISVYLMMAYNKGADGMELWFNSQFPPGLYSRIIQMNKVVPNKTGAALGWFIFGMVVMILLLYGRRFWFWLPHPIGMIMLVNPLMGSYWFSIFLGWAAKSLVTKYGNKDTYRSFLCFFIGIILSEILWVALYFIVAFIMGVGRLELTLDRVA